jgi:hypothetical protein
VYVIANQELCVVARKPDFVCVVEKATWLFGIWLQAWLVCDCKKLKFVIAKSAGLFLWLQKKEKKNWTSVWLQLFGVSDCKAGVMCVSKKPDFVCVLAKLLGYLEYDCKPG